MTPIPKFEIMAGHLEETGLYRVLRRVEPFRYSAPTAGPETRVVLLDTETDGIGPDCRPTEIAIKAFTVDGAHRLTSAGVTESWLESPGRPLSAIVSRVTGLTDADLDGKRFPANRIHAALMSADLIVAHNAAFDRPVVEKRFGVMGKRWACSMSEIPWADLGCPSRALGVVANHCGLFFDAHRAAADVDALAAILCRDYLDSTYLAALIDSSLRSTRRIWAQGSAFEMKDALKARGYKWNDGAQGEPPRTWYFDAMTDESFSAEMAFLLANRINPRLTHLDATTRYR
jgi:DNA polymerase-3 subunit epsilon